MKPALVILSTEINQSWINFLQHEKLQEHFDTYIVCDSIESFNAYNSKKHNAYNKTRVTAIDERVCADAGYKNSMHIPGKTHINKEVVALDKALYYFCELENVHEYVWLIEDDVFIPSVEAMIKLDRKCGPNDLCTTSHKCKTDDVMDWHWPHITEEIGEHLNKPWFYSMSCAIRISRYLLTTISDYVRETETLFFNEVIFNTLANIQNMSVFTPTELRSVVWRGEFGLDDFLMLPNNLFHPLKNIDQHTAIRSIINDIRNYGDYTPANKLPNFLKETLHE